MQRSVWTWLGLRSASAAGDQLWTVALAWTAVHVASPAAAGAVVAAGTIPRAVALLLGGVVADRYDARRVMALADLARVAVLVAVCVRVALGPPSLGVLLAAAIAFGLAEALHDPAGITVGRQLVPPEQMPSYAGAGQTLTRLGDMAGAAAGGFVVAAWGLGGSAALDAVTFAVAAAYLLAVMRPSYPLVRGPVEPPLRSIVAGFAHLRDEPVTRTLVITLSGLNLFVGPAEGIGLALRARAEGWGAASVGVFLGLIGVGAALGSVAMLRWRPHSPVTVSFGLLVLQGAAIVVCGEGGRWLVGLGAAVIGVTAGVASVLLSTLFQTIVDGAYLGRMGAIQRLGDDALMPLAMAGFGALASATSIGTAFTSYGLAMSVAMLVPLSNRRLRGIRLERRPASPAARRPCAPASPLA